ncbi:MAG: hypothetical protein GXO18_05510 [Aquificae bacterium]|nr:hypothetical protein [Aquificota bacterium]
MNTEEQITSRLDGEYIIKHNLRMTSKKPGKITIIRHFKYDLVLKTAHYKKATALIEAKYRTKPCRAATYIIISGLW